VSVPGRSSVYRALVRNGRTDPAWRRRRRFDYKRWERGRPMELWQMDVVGARHARTLQISKHLKGQSRAMRPGCRGRPSPRRVEDSAVRYAFSRQIAVQDNGVRATA
jgi:hypothetical protein